MQTKFRFTKQKIEALPVPEKGVSVQYHDEGCDNLILRVTSASRRFCFYGRVLNEKTGKRSSRCISLGEYPHRTIEQARKEVSKIKSTPIGTDPFAERNTRKEAATLKDLFEHWLEVYGKPLKRSWGEDQRKFDKHFKEWHNRKLSAIHVADVQAWHGKIGREHGRYLANRCKALLSTLFNKAHEVGFTGPNPCQKVANFPEQSRERFLLPDEMKAFFVALHQEDELWRDFFLLCLFTGSRRGNVASMRWAELDLTSGVWHIPQEKTKNKKPGVVALVQPAVVILQERRERGTGSEWVFPSVRGNGHISDPKKAWARILVRSGIKDLHVHDLRRSLGSWQAGMGASLVTIGASLGHADLKSTQVYSRLQLDPVRASVAKAVDGMLLAGGVVLLAPPKREE